MGTEDALKAADEALACIATIGESRTAYEFNGNLDIIANTTSLSTASIKATVDDLKTLLSEFGLRADVFRYEQSRPQLIVLCEFCWLSRKESFKLIVSRRKAEKSRPGRSGPGKPEVDG
jgi:hypothetical protein